LADAWDLTADAPPEELLASQQALWWLQKGDFKVGPEWERAHAIAQGHEGERGHDLVHALVHWIEGDHGNSDYWYRRAGATRSSEKADEEWAVLKAHFEK
jgi:hypothetical protein